MAAAEVEQEAAQAALERGIATRLFLLDDRASMSSL